MFDALCAALPEDIHVFWLSRLPAQYGEPRPAGQGVDILILAPDAGVLVLTAKGGLVALPAQGTTAPSPLTQATSAAAGIADFIRQARLLPSSECPPAKGMAVLPDTPRSRQDVIGTAADALLFSDDMTHLDAFVLAALMELQGEGSQLALITEDAIAAFAVLVDSQDASGENVNTTAFSPSSVGPADRSNSWSGSREIGAPSQPRSADGGQHESSGNEPVLDIQPRRGWPKWSYPFLVAALVFFSLAIGQYKAHEFVYPHYEGDNLSPGDFATLQRKQAQETVAKWRANQAAPKH